MYYHNDNQTKDFLRRLSSEEMQALRLILGRVALEVYAPYLEVCRLWYAAPSISIPLGGEFIVVESDWVATPKEGIDYHMMHVSISDHPRDIPKAFDKSGRKMIGSPASKIEIGPPRSAVAAVAILERQEIGTEEEVQYDSGLVFTLADGRRFAIGARQSIIGGLECSTDSSCIDEFIAENRVRQVLN